MNILVTGVAGFIGFHLAKRLLAQGHRVYGIDNLNNYYDVCLKQDRLQQLLTDSQFAFEYLDIGESPWSSEIICQSRFFLCS